LKRKEQGREVRRGFPIFEETIVIKPRERTKNIERACRNRNYVVSTPSHGESPFHPSIGTATRPSEPLWSAYKIALYRLRIAL